MNPTRALGVLLLVIGVGWFLAVPTVLPAAYHGHVHTGHEHAQYAANPIEPGEQSTARLTAASEHAVVVHPDRDWVVADAGSLSDIEHSAFEDARAGEANASEESPTSDQYQRLAEEHPFVLAESGQWFELELTMTANYTRVTTNKVETAAVTRAVAVSPALSGPTGKQARTLATTDGAVLVSAPSLPTPLYLTHGDEILRVVHVGGAPEPPSLPAFVMFLLPGVILALLGVYLERTG